MNALDKQVSAAPLIRSVAALRKVVSAWKRADQRIAVVPTMGALHAGHLSLVSAAKKCADRVIVTIFVNPKQFNNPDDLTDYPRSEMADVISLAPFAVDVIYAPMPAEMYPNGFSTNISVSGVSAGLCGACRPGHFDGVATIVAKLLLQTGADQAFFGDKDYQQLQVVKKLVKDLDIPARIIGCPTVRDADGLALSSRNALLDTAQRRVAPALYHALVVAAGALETGHLPARQGSPCDPLEHARAAILAAGFESVEYLELRSADDLEPLVTANRPARLLVAARLGGVRLIDNIAVASNPLNPNEN